MLEWMAVASTTVSGWIRPALAIGALVLIVGPMIAMSLAWAARGKRPDTVRKCALVAMMGAVVATALLLGPPLVRMSDADGSGKRRLMREWGTAICVFQAAVFSLAWLASRAPRGPRRTVDDAA